jgi:hypothetical protein
MHFFSGTAKCGRQKRRRLAERLFSLGPLDVLNWGECLSLVGLGHCTISGLPGDRVTDATYYVADLYQ